MKEIDVDGRRTHDEEAFAAIGRQGLAWPGHAGRACNETPDDTLIQAWRFDDIISLDPAEMYEISTYEFVGNALCDLISIDPTTRPISASRCRELDDLR